MKRWIKICLVMSMTLLVTGGHVRYLYAGEFGGFDIDIGAGDDIFDNWEEEQEGKQDSAEPEQKEIYNGSYYHFPRRFGTKTGRKCVRLGDGFIRNRALRLFRNVTSL